MSGVDCDAPIGATQENFKKCISKRISAVDNAHDGVVTVRGSSPRIWWKW